MKNYFQYYFCLILFIPIVLSAQRNPQDIIRDYGDIFSSIEEGNIVSKANQLTTAKTWEVVVITHSTSIPQVDSNKDNWLLNENNTVVFHLPVADVTDIPQIEVSTDLEGSIPMAIRLDIAYNVMFPLYQSEAYGQAVEEGINALLADQGVLESIAFENAYLVKDAESPQWRVVNPTTAGNEAGYIAGSVCYKRNDMLSLLPKFAYTGSLSGNDLKIKAVVTGNGENADTDNEQIINATVNNNIIEPLANQRIEIDVGDKIDYWPSFAVEWYLSYDNGQSWEFIRTTNNKVYVVWNEPSYGNTQGMNEPMLYYGCTQARTIDSDEPNLINVLWNKFQNRQLNIIHFKEIVQPKAITYYNNPYPNHSSEGILSSQPAENDFYLDGECGAFSDLWYYILRYQGIEGIVKAVNPIAQGEFFLVNNWQFGTPSFPGEHYPYVNAVPEVDKILLGTNSEDEEIFEILPDIRRENHAYEWSGSPEVTDLTGLAGQGGVDNPYSDFGNHYIVLANGKYYDPSYGNSYNTIKEWEEASIKAFYILQEVTSQENLGQTYYYLRIRENLSNVEDITD